jgi:ABC-type lipoprotein export system ATPase subunit
MVIYSVIENIVLWAALIVLYGVSLVYIFKWHRLKTKVLAAQSVCHSFKQQPLNTEPAALKPPSENAGGNDNNRVPGQNDNPISPQPYYLPPQVDRLPDNQGALIFEGVTKTFKLDEKTLITPVNNINLEIAQGEFVVILGRSGTGKTTLLNLAAGLVKPSSGIVKLAGNTLGGMTQKELSTLRGQKIGFIFQFPSLIPALTVKDNITLPSIFNGEDSGKTGERAENLLGMLGLSDKMGVFPRQLSAGETKRVVVARSLINEPHLILADEPTSDLDSRTEQEVLEILREINAKGVTFLIVTHSLQLVPYATRAFQMENGCLKQITTNN